MGPPPYAWLGQIMIALGIAAILHSVLIISMQKPILSKISLLAVGPTVLITVIIALYIFPRLFEYA